jgi:tetratricopeptide (TPR) repeat protein
MGRFNIGSILAAKGRHEQAVEAFILAEKEGYNLYNLSFQAGLSLLALGKLHEAYRQFEITKSMNPPSPTYEILLVHMGRTALQIGRSDLAIPLLTELVEKSPAHPEGRFFLAMSLIAGNRPGDAKPILDKLVAEGGKGPAHYGRALANYGLKRKAEAVADIDTAVRMEPRNPHLREWQAKIRAMP